MAMSLPHPFLKEEEELEGEIGGVLPSKLLAQTSTSPEAAEPLIPATTAPAAAATSLTRRTTHTAAAAAAAIPQGGKVKGH